MVFLKRPQNPSRKRPPSSSFVSPFPSQKLPKSAAEVPDHSRSATEKMAAILAEAGVTLLDPSGPPCVPFDHHKLRRHIQRLLSGESPHLRSDFLSGLSDYITSSTNLRRILAPARSDRVGIVASESLLRNLLLVPSIQLDVQTMLLEKLPEYFDVCEERSSALLLGEDVARLILNHFRWLDFVVDPSAFTEKLMQVLSISPLHLRKEIIGSLPEIIGSESNKTVVESLEQMLQEDSEIVVAVLDAFSNLNLDDQLQEQVITIAISCIRTIDVEHMPFLLRFLLLSATPTNAGRIISQIREQLKFVGLSHIRTTQQRKLKGKSNMNNSEASILDALRSSLRFKNMLCQEILKELSSLQKPRDHKVIDIWLLILIYMNGESLQKRVEQIFKKKIIEGCIQEHMFDQCICGLKELVKDYFPSFISLSEYLLACKEQKARDFGVVVYTIIFKEFTDSYSRQEVLGSLVTLVGSGVNYVVSSALETMGLLASKHVHDLVPLSPHITGILDYLEGFGVENLHKVYEVFSQLAVFARSNADLYRSPFTNELMMIVRKQVGHVDLKFKKIGLIGTLKIVSRLGDASAAGTQSLYQKSNCEEAVELLKMSLEACKQLPLSLVMFYDELSDLMERDALHPTIVEWVGKHVGDFESMFLSDLDDGKLPVKDLYCDLEGELWMNLDGDISPVCLNILPLVSSSLQSTSLQVLPANFLLLSTIERLTNQGSLGGIDALLGCPLHLPSPKYFLGDGWKSLTTKQKQVSCLSIYYAANWIRELLNAFSSQISNGFDFTSQATKEDVVAKLLKRLRNLVFLESLLNFSIGRCNMSLPELHMHVDHSGTSNLNQGQHARHVEKKSDLSTENNASSSDNKRTCKTLTKTSSSSDSSDKLKQPTIFEMLKKAGAISSQDVPSENSSGLSPQTRSESSEQHPHGSNEPTVVEISAVSKALEGQRSKFRCLLPQSFSMLSLSKSQDSCCSDPSAEFPLFLYLLRDLHQKLDYFSPPIKQIPGRSSGAPTGFTKISEDKFYSEVMTVFPRLKRHLETAVCLFKEVDEACEEHWNIQSTSAGNPNLPNFVLTKSSVSTLVFKEILYCFREIINLPDMQMKKATLLPLLDAFQLAKLPDDFLSGVEFNLSPGTVEYLYVGVYAFIESVLSEACSFSFMMASESLITLDSIIVSIKKFINSREEKDNQLSSGFIQVSLPILCQRLGTSAEKLLKHSWDATNLENGWKNKGDVVQKILRIHLENSVSTSALLDEITQLAFPGLSGNGVEGEYSYGFPTLNSATFTVWYRVLHERNLTVLTKLVHSIILKGKRQANDQQHEPVEESLIKLRHSVNVLVSLVALCKTSDKMAVHAMAVKYGGKYVDSFLKVFDFLQAQFNGHSESIIQMVRELQKATRTIQTLCSEAKGLKQTTITCKIPATKRSMERFLFHVKGLVHTSGCTFWLGNLKHKDLGGQEVSSQIYRDDLDEDFTEDPTEAFQESIPDSTSEDDKVEE